MLKILLTRQSRKFIDTLPAKQFRQIVTKVISLSSDPEPLDSIHIKGYPYRRADIGEYRIIYRVADDCLHVAIICKRNDSQVYKILKRK